jgi:hypothetical protein
MAISTVCSFITRSERMMPNGHYLIEAKSSREFRGLLWRREVGFAQKFCSLAAGQVGWLGSRIFG